MLKEICRRSLHRPSQPLNCLYRTEQIVSILRGIGQCRAAEPTAGE